MELSSVDAFGIPGAEKSVERGIGVPLLLACLGSLHPCAMRRNPHQITTRKASTGRGGKCSSCFHLPTSRQAVFDASAQSLEAETVALTVLHTDGEPPRCFDALLLVVAASRGVRIS